MAQNTGKMVIIIMMRILMIKMMMMCINVVNIDGCANGESDWGANILEGLLS